MHRQNDIGSSEDHTLPVPTESKPPEDQFLLTAEEKEESKIQWYSHPRFVGIAAISSLALAAIGLLPIFVQLFQKEEPNWMIALLSCCVTILCFVSAWSVMELRRNHNLLFDVASVRKDLEKRSRLYRARESRLQSQIKMQSEIIEARTAKERYMAELFRDIARTRADHSTRLYAIQAAIFATPEFSRRSFSQSWRRQKEFLSDYCTFASRLFSELKRRECCANIKVLWDAIEASTLDNLINTECGVSSSQVSSDRIGYQTIARCQISKNNGRIVGEQAGPRALNENIIFRRLYSGRYDYFISNNIAEDIDKWNSEVISRVSRTFVFPDLETHKFYHSIIVVPIYVEGFIEDFDGVSAEKITRIIGFLSIDSNSSDVEFDISYDLALCQQMAFDIASSFFEYFRCVRHMEARNKAI